MTTDDAFWSLASEYDWVCDSAELGSTVMTAQNVGIILSALIFMQLSDSWGRSPVFHITNIIYIVLRLVALQVTFNYWVFVVLIAFGSTYAPLGIRIGYTLVAEYTDEKAQCLKITHNVAFNFFSIFDLLKLTCLVTLFDRKL